MNIEQLKQQESELIKQLDENRSHQRELNIITFIEKYGFNIGDDVEIIDGNKNRKAKVVSFGFNGETGVRRVKTLLYTSKGELGKSFKDIWSFDFDKITKLNKLINQ